MIAVRLQYLLLWAVLVAAFIWPALLNGGPIWFSDSFSYLNGPKTALEQLFGGDGGGALQGLAEPADSVAKGQDTPYAGRSIYFGFVMFSAFAMLGPFGVAALNAAIFVTALMVALRPFFSDRLRGTLFVGVAIALLTAAPFFTSYAMPDFLAGITIICAVRLMGVPDKPTRAEAWVLWVIMLLGLISHTSHLIVVTGLAIVAPAVFRIYTGSWRIGNSRTLMVAVGLAIFAEALFAATVTRIYGEPPLRPPFLSARMIDDGPGYDYLVENCPEAGFALCAFVDRLPQYSDEILWGREEGRAVYAGADAETQKALSSEQMKFALAVLKDRPGAQIQASLTRFGEQLRWFGLEEFAYFPALKATLDDWFSGAQKDQIRATGFYAETFPLAAANVLTKIVALISLVHLLSLALIRSDAQKPQQEEIRRGFVIFAVLIALAILGNAATTGILSTPHARYQARVIWLLPMLSAIVIWRDLLAENMRARARRTTL